eukprot:2083474-Prymnesium_polylepis.1
MARARMRPSTHGRTVHCAPACGGGAPTAARAPRERERSRTLVGPRARWHVACASGGVRRCGLRRASCTLAVLASRACAPSGAGGAPPASPTAGIASGCGRRAMHLRWPSAPRCAAELRAHFAAGRSAPARSGRAPRAPHASSPAQRCGVRTPRCGSGAIPSNASRRSAPRRAAAARAVSAPPSA